jgi:uracil-DNA glycosylase family 4
LAKSDDGFFGRAEERLRFYAELDAGFILNEEGEKTARPSPFQTDDRAAGGPEEGLEDVARAVRACRKCPLAGLRRQAVPGEGRSAAELMFVGEAPGEEEDLQGRPFVGRAGHLLDRIITAMRFRREDVFIANILKCRPPNNRDPHQDEVLACSPYLHRQIELIRPKAIVALGKPAANFFSGGSLPISLLRGRFLDFHGIPVMPTYHPAFLLRNEDNRTYKKQTWEDMQKVMALLGKS